ncbi:MAG TPA: MerR family transcriptional regulator [Gemmatimonadales bacterium]|nr:MerR family transcriptional regulator [Gemmatimonadales bacterium]
MTARSERAVQEFYSIGEVCILTDLKPHVLRYWESQFRFLNPAKNRSGNRVYKAKEVELIMLVKHLLYTEKYTIEGARHRIDQYRRTGELRPSARQAFEAQLVQEAREELERVLAVLEGRPVIEPEPEPAAAPAGAGAGARGGAAAGGGGDARSARGKRRG